MAEQDRKAVVRGKAPSRRVRLEPNIYERTGADGRRRLELGYRDSTGKQRWKAVSGGLKAARGERDRILGQREAATKGRAEAVVPVKLAFGDAAERWLAEQVADLRPATRAVYSGDVRNHLVPRWGRRRLDTIGVDDCAQLVRELRAAGKSEWTISGVLKVASRVFKFARRRMHWRGQNPVALLERGERPSTGATQKRRIYRGDELGQTLAAAHEPWRTLFALAAVSGARLSELLALTWADVGLEGPEQATIEITAQVDRHGVRQPLKTEAAERVVELPRSLYLVLMQHRARSPYKADDALVFCTRTGRALGQRNVLRALRLAQTKARDDAGELTFPALHVRDERGAPVPVPRGAVPNFHGFRHSAASEAIAAGESAEEVSWQLGHRNTVVTRTVYLQEIRSAERSARRRDQMERRYGSVLEAAGGSDSPQQSAAAARAESLEVVDLREIRDKAQHPEADAPNF